MIKIAFVIDTIESPTAGTEKQLLLLIRHLDRHKFMPFLCVLRSSPWLKESFNDCPLYEMNVSSYWKMDSYLHVWRFSRFLKSQQIGIVQTYFNDSNKAGILAAKLAGRCSVISSRRNQGYWHTPIELCLLKLLNRGVDLFVANSFSTKEWAVSVEGIAENKISVVHNGYDFAGTQHHGASEDRIRCREKWGASPETRVVGMVANLRPVKRHDIFLQAARSVVCRHPDTRFVLVGDGNERHNLERLAKELGIGTNVCFMGKWDDVPPLLEAFDIGVLSSDSESFSNAVVEYLAAGLPIVSTDVGGSREAIEPGETGYIVPTGDSQALADAICKIIDDTHATERAKAGRRKAEALFSMETMVNNYENLYLEIACEDSRT